MKRTIGIFLMGLLLVGCEGNGTISGEMSGKYESTTTHSYTEKVNGKTVKETNSKTTSSGGFENDFNVVIGNGDTTLAQNEIPVLNPKISCTKQLSLEDVEVLKTKVSQAHLDKNRVLTAKILINDWCLTSNQVRDVLALFTMDKYRLEFAKFAYGHVTDRINYGRVKDAFSFDATKQLLDNYINTL
ncbi:DUF4476 domain-containing protein [Aureispira sp. CCB-E]|uniref:DUF4476 domain-containing protein n=1 Tax=Aureispira sp. CCB-E TaxID=3051121 RepID=UPI002868A159|nr:DUF4476 domain-containing protein [Aureispira sp. CCB-E]WMX12699.1 DUF4476 domain-containing protein [Aureispira sp. CCB-E]